MITTGTLFILLTLAHIWRAIEEGIGLVKNPWWVLITLAAAPLSIRAFRLLRSSKQT